VQQLVLLQHLATQKGGQHRSDANRVTRSGGISPLGK
jgi:hypothetical protein